MSVSGAGEDPEDGDQRDDGQRPPDDARAGSAVSRKSHDGQTASSGRGLESYLKTNERLLRNGVSVSPELKIEGYFGRSKS